MLSLPQESSIDVNLLERMQEENIVTSYKLFWFRGIFKEIINQNKEITFRRIVCRMIAEAWYPLIEYHLNFGAIDMLYDLCILIHRKYKIESNISEHKLLAFLEDLNDKEIERGIRNLYNMVPYRLLAPFFVGEFKEIPDHRRNKKIAELSHLKENVFYKIDDKNKSITINQNWFDYIYRNQSIVYGWMSYKLIYFLQNRNPNVPAIPFKLAAPQERNLASARSFWNDVNDIMPLYDIYTSKELTERNFKEYGGLSIDHFIPWSFVLHDELWNLVPTFHNINSSKNNSDAVWACASLLHVPLVDLSSIFSKVAVALKTGGYFYGSFKQGEFEAERNGRYFTDLTKEKLEVLLEGVVGLEVVEVEITGDVRVGREGELWLNFIVRKV